MADNEDTGNQLKPLDGVVLCSTALGQDVRTRVAGWATDLGARHLLDLTKDVTHLIIGSVATPKYRFVAKNRPDVKVLSLAWIEEVRSIWMEDSEVDLPALEAKHRYPTFADLSICITGFTNIDERNKLEELFRNNGATYSGDLSKQISHLVVAAPTGAKYTHAKQWGLNCVSVRWVTDSLTRGMALDETLYDPLLPEDEQGRGAFLLLEDVKPQRKRPVEDDESQDISKRRKFRRTASTRLETHSQDLWQGMRAHESADGTKVDQWDDKTTKHANSQNPTLDIKPVMRRPSITHDSNEPEHGKLLSGWHIFLHAFDKPKAQKLRNVIQESCGATISNTLQDLHPAADAKKRTCILVPHNPDFDQDRMPTLHAETLVATEWWVERCIIRKRIINPAHDRLSRPFWRVDVQGMQQLKITSTGFSSLDLRQLAAVVSLTGAQYEEYMSTKTSVLLCAQSSVEIRREKKYYAIKHKIPVVTIDWLWATVDAQRLVDFETYRVHLDVDDDDAMRKSESHASLPATTHKSVARGPFILDDENEPPAKLPQHLGVAAVKPLAERSPNTSPPKQLPAEKPIEAASMVRLSADLASLSNQLQQQAKRDRSAAVTSQQRRRAKKLGRASSGILHRSGSLASVELSNEGCFDLFDDETSRPGTAQNEPESTQLGYEVPDAEAHRQHMAKKMGLSLTDERDSRRLASLGLVKDSEHVSADGIARSRRTRAGR